MTQPSPNSDMLTAFVPCRKGSVRVPRKNTRPFAGYDDGLIDLKLSQLSACKEYDQIIVSSDDEDVLAIAERWARSSPVPIISLDRPPELAIVDTLDAFVAYIHTIIPNGHIAWTHVTSPLFGTEHMDKAAQVYRQALADGDHDSLMSVERIQTFSWRDGTCLSHDRDAVKWPQTQDLSPIFAVNSAVFMAPVSTYRDDHDRIGKNPYMYETDILSGYDIDWPEDFDTAEMLVNALNAKR